MSADLFKRVRSLLSGHIKVLNEHAIGDTHADDAQAIIDEIDILLKSDELKEVEKHIDDAERKVVSDDLAQEILNGKFCVGGHCDD
tara:strand:- start:1683 stop:1940 length:258 start_codon:yes stop_codon:yes gene_type:complete